MFSDLKAQVKQNPLQNRQQLKREEINKLIQDLKVKLSREEYQLMKEEEDNEQDRQELEKTADNVGELRRLQKIHGVERARFQDRLTALMKDHELKVEKYR